ncbi:MAG TPA: DUF192 domain-containing protein [Candidatus Paceibacterota bacterium]
MGHLAFRPKWYHIIILASIGLAILLWAQRSDLPLGGPTSENVVKKQVSATLGTVPLYLEVADTDTTREQGLSGRTSMPDDNGMLFVFDEPDTHTFWMKDMLFDLDFIWLDANKTVVEITPNVSKDSYPEFYAPSGPVLYMLELKAGTAARENIQIGDVFNLP